MTSRRIWFAVVAVAAAALVALGGRFAVADQPPKAPTMTMRGPAGALLLAALGDESELAVRGAAALVAENKLADPEAGRVPEAMRAAYTRLRAEEGRAPPSPVLAAVASGGLADGIELVVEGVLAPRGALVFLHGYGGNFALPCWQVAQAARRAGLVTVCPSAGLDGDWTTAAAEATVRRAVADARARYPHVLLGGLSNGAVGASLLAPKLRNDLAGLVLIAGAASSARASGLPALVVQGKRDRMSPAAIARGYASRTAARYVEVDAGHFALLTRAAEVENHLAAWLVAH